MGQMIPYSVPGHVIGGSEPKSWKASKQAAGKARVAPTQRSPRPKALGRTIKAIYDSRCHWCAKLVRRGELISMVRIDRDKRWIHRSCAA